MTTLQEGDLVAVRPWSSEDFALTGMEYVRRGLPGHVIVRDGEGRTWQVARVDMRRTGGP